MEKDFAMKFSRFVAVVTVASLLLGASVLRAQNQTKKRNHKKAATVAAATKAPDVITGKDAFNDYTEEKPGIFRRITVADLPEPFATESVDNGPRVVPRPSGAWPQTLPGFKVELYASDLDNPRLIRTAPNGDIFLAESHPGIIKVLRGVTKDGRAEK